MDKWIIKLKVMPNSVISATCSPPRMKWSFSGNSVKSVFQRAPMRVLVPTPCIPSEAVKPSCCSSLSFGRKSVWFLCCPTSEPTSLWVRKMGVQRAMEKVQELTHLVDLPFQEKWPAKEKNIYFQGTVYKKMLQFWFLFLCWGQD